MAAPRLGVTGGIGSGKSTVIGMLAARGAAVIDTDAIAHALTAPGGSAIEPLRAAFGAAAIGTDGGLDRAHVRALVFADADARRRLEAILHPRILAQCQSLARQRADAPLLVLDVPLLAEAADFRQALALDRILVVDCPPERQRERVLARDGLPPAQIDAIIAAQAPRQARLALADDVLVNAGTPEQLAAKVDRLWAAYRPAPACAAAGPAGAL